MSGEEGVRLTVEIDLLPSSDPGDQRALGWRATIVLGGKTYWSDGATVPHAIEALGRHLLRAPEFRQATGTMPKSVAVEDMEG